MVMEKVRDRLTHRECMGKRNPHSNWLGKQEGPNVMSSCNRQGLKPGVLKLSGLHRDRALKAPCCSWRQDNQSKDIVWKQRGEECLGHTVDGGQVIHPSQSEPQRDSTHGKTPLGTRNWSGPFSSPAPQHKHRAICRNQHSPDTPTELVSTKSCPWCSGTTTLPSLLCLSPSTAGTLPEKTSLDCCSHGVSPHGSFVEPEF